MRDILETSHVTWARLFTFPIRKTFNIKRNSEPRRYQRGQTYVYYSIALRYERSSNLLQGLIDRIPHDRSRVGSTSDHRLCSTVESHWRTIVWTIVNVVCNSAMDFKMQLRLFLYQNQNRKIMGVELMLQKYTCAYFRSLTGATSALSDERGFAISHIQDWND